MEHLIFDSLSQIAWVGLIIGLGQFVYAAMGFGAGLISISLLALFFGNIETFVPFFLLLCLPTETWIVVRQRVRALSTDFFWLLAFILPTLILGGLILKAASDRRLMLGLGILIVAIALFYLFFEGSLNLKPKGKVFSACAGAMSGILASLYGMGGPPLIVYFKSLGLDKDRFRASLLTIFFVMSLIRVVAYGAMGLYNATVVWSCLITLPFGLVGLALGNWAHGRVPEATFKTLTSLALLLSGALVLAKAV